MGHCGAQALALSRWRHCIGEVHCASGRDMSPATRVGVQHTLGQHLQHDRNGWEGPFESRSGFYRARLKVKAQYQALSQGLKQRKMGGSRALTSVRSACRARDGAFLRQTGSSAREQMKKSSLGLYSAWFRNCTASSRSSLAGLMVSRG